jgi:DNA primase
MNEAISVDELVKLISNPDGTIYPFSFSANMMAAHGVNQKLVDYFHAAATQMNRAATDRTMILSDYKHGVPYSQAAADSFLRWNPHLLPDGANR